MWLEEYSWPSPLHIKHALLCCAVHDVIGLSAYVKWYLGCIQHELGCNAQWIIRDGWLHSAWNMMAVLHTSCMAGHSLIPWLKKHSLFRCIALEICITRPRHACNMMVCLRYLHSACNMTAMLHNAWMDCIANVLQCCCTICRVLSVSLCTLLGILLSVRVTWWQGTTGMHYDEGIQVYCPKVQMVYCRWANPKAPVTLATTGNKNITDQEK